jgi:hypothetical protein
MVIFVGKQHILPPKDHFAVTIPVSSFIIQSRETARIRRMILVVYMLLYLKFLLRNLFSHETQGMKVYNWIYYQCWESLYQTYNPRWLDCQIKLENSLEGKYIHISLSDVSIACYLTQITVHNINALFCKNANSVRVKESL